MTDPIRASQTQPTLSVDDDGLGFIRNADGQIVPVNPAATVRLTRMMDNMEKTGRRLHILEPK